MSTELFRRCFAFRWNRNCGCNSFKQIFSQKREDMRVHNWWCALQLKAYHEDISRQTDRRVAERACVLLWHQINIVRGKLSCRWNKMRHWYEWTPVSGHYRLGPEMAGQRVPIFSFGPKSPGGRISWCPPLLWKVVTSEQSRQNILLPWKWLGIAPLQLFCRVWGASGSGLMLAGLRSTFVPSCWFPCVAKGEQKLCSCSLRTIQWNLVDEVALTFNRAWKPWCPQENKNERIQGLPPPRPEFCTRRHRKVYRRVFQNDASGKVYVQTRR